MMFFRSTPSPPPSPCSLQTATLTTWRYELVGGGFHEYVRVDTDASSDPEVQFRATLNCPMTAAEVSGSICRGEANAVISARHQLLEVACNTCPLYGRTPVEIDLYYAEEAHAKAARLRAEADLAQAQVQYAKALAELNDSTAAIITPQLVS